MECSCYSDYGECGDVPSFSAETWHTARTHHTCCECSETIVTGRRYERAVGVYDGRWETYKTCEPCVRIRRDYCYYWIYGELVEVIQECLGFNYVTGE